MIDPVPHLPRIPDLMVGHPWEPRGEQWGTDVNNREYWPGGEYELPIPVIYADVVQRWLDSPEFPLDPAEFGQHLHGRILPPFPRFWITARVGDDPAEQHRTLLALANFYGENTDAQFRYEQAARAAENVKPGGWTEACAFVGVVDVPEMDTLRPNMGFAQQWADPDTGEIPRWLIHVRSFARHSWHSYEALAMLDPQIARRYGWGRASLEGRQTRVIVGAGMTLTRIRENGSMMDDWHRAKYYADPRHVQRNVPVGEFVLTDVEEAVGAARPLALFTMATLANRAPVEYSAGREPTRQQRRLAERKGEEARGTPDTYHVLAIDPDRAPTGSHPATGTGRQVRGPYEVRSHLRWLKKQGRYTVVRAHWRGLKHLERLGEPPKATKGYRVAKMPKRLRERR